MDQTIEPSTYERLKEMAVTYRLRPGDRLNEGALARELGVSRTPLREALNRLVAEKFFTFQPGSGFFCRGLDVGSVFDLFEMRRVIETAAVRMACERASDAELDALDRDLVENGMEVRGLTIAQACARDEAFHIAIAALSKNQEILTELERINERIRYIRWVSMTAKIAERSKLEHREIVDAMLARDANKAASALERHIERRMDQVNEAVRQGVANIYTNIADGYADQVL